jgi:hypothetical protein
VKLGYQLFPGRDFGIVGFLQYVQHGFRVHLVKIRLAVDEYAGRGRDLVAQALLLGGDQLVAGLGIAECAFKRGAIDPRCHGPLGKDSRGKAVEALVDQQSERPQAAELGGAPSNASGRRSGKGTVKTHWVAYPSLLCRCSLNRGSTFVRNEEPTNEESMGGRYGFELPLGDDQNPLTVTGTELCVVVPVPSSHPMPQHCTAPPLNNAQVWVSPAAMATAFEMPGTGTELSVVVPLPS